MKNLERRQKSFCSRTSWPIGKQTGQEPSWLTSWWTASSGLEQNNPWQSGLELAFTQGGGKETGMLVHSPIPPTVGQLSLTSSWAAPALWGSDSNRKGRHTDQVNGVSQWQSRKSHWGRNSDLCGKTDKPHPPLMSTWKALPYQDSGLGTRKGPS